MGSTTRIGWTKAIRIWERDKGCCTYCGLNLTATNSTLDHVIPRNEGGTNDFDNLVLSCRKCNNKKDNFPGSSQLRALRRIQQKLAKYEQEKENKRSEKIPEDL